MSINSSNRPSTPTRNVFCVIYLLILAKNIKNLNFDSYIVLSVHSSVLYKFGRIIQDN
ncbi:hypothetical protein BpHYR1_020461 [Brachionus plicatilis]|uniref:Uncharacterized protein n=1 Tax=Brachionus plicatilis TaxID=10195 RepID=A0A3M7QGP8_BRAPC|nr:hypothetical protein BpHYR1_020461 [Brachionus plicatilis]